MPRMSPDAKTGPRLAAAPILLLAALAAVGLLLSPAGCSKDDDPAQPAGTTADLALAAAADAALVEEDQTVTFTLTLQNLGPDAATGIRVGASLPAGLTRTSFLVVGGSFDTGTGIWTLSSLAADGSAVLKLVCAVDPGTGGRVLALAAEILDQDLDDPEPANDAAEASVTVAGIDLAVTKQIVDPDVDAGETATFLIRVRNASIAGATEVAVRDELPAGLAYEADLASQGAFAPDTGIWSVGALAGGAEATLTLLARVQAGTEGQTLTNTALLHAAAPPDGTAGNDTAQAVVVVAAAHADLQLSVDVDEPRPNVGQDLTIFVVATNAGPNTATGIRIAAAPPQGLDFVAARTDSGSYSFATGLWSLPSLRFAATATLALTVRVEAGTGGQTLVAQAEVVAAGQPDPDPADDVASAGLTVQSADLALAKTVDQDEPAELEEVLFSVTVRNDGPDAAQDVAVADLLPFGLTFAGAEPVGVYAAQSGVWIVGDLAAGGQATLQLRAQVNMGTAGGSIVNSAAVAACDQEDPDPADDVAVASITVRGAVVPVANPDQYLGQEGGTLQVTAEGGVLANDVSPSGRPLAAVLVSQPGHGTVALQADGSFTYVHDGSQTASDAFTYRARDTQTLVMSNLATVTVAVTEVNDAPTAVADAYDAQEGATLLVPAETGVLANDTDPEGDPLSAVVLTPPAHGSLDLLPDGGFTYVHDGSETATDVFTYAARDTAGAQSGPATVTLDVAPANDPPVAVADTLVVAEGGLQSGAARENDFDPDDLTGTLTAVAGDPPAHGELLAFFDDGYFTYRHDGGETTLDGFTYTLQDPQGAVSAPGTVVVLVTPVNDAPAAADFAVEVAAGDTVTIDFSAHVQDPDDAAADLTITITGGPAQAVSFAEVAPGVWEYVHDGVGTGADAITFTVTDGQGAVSAEATATVTVL